jgi:hypothetical protein
MGMLDAMAGRLRAGAEMVTFRPRGHSMEPLIRDGQQVTVYGVPPDCKFEPGDIVLVTVHGTTYLHKILAVSGDRIQVGNNRGGVNGWTHPSKVWGHYLQEHGSPENS